MARPSTSIATTRCFGCRSTRKDLAARVEPMPLPITGFAQAEYRRQFDLMPDGRQFLMLFPSGR